ncbi:hypothetical protein AMTRI_Chr05g58910 [Amborella trichopoda]
MFTCCHGTSRCKQNSRFVSKSMNIVEPDVYSGFVWWFFTRKKAWIVWKTICMEL